MEICYPKLCSQSGHCLFKVNVFTTLFAFSSFHSIVARYKTGPQNE